MVTARRFGTNSNESTYDTAGGSDYTSLAAWESDTSINLVAAAAGETLLCAPGVHPESATTFNGAITNSLYYRIVKAAPGSEPKGIPGAGPVFSFAAGGNCLYQNEDYITFQDFCVTARGAGNINGIIVSASRSYIIGTIVYDLVTTGIVHSKYCYSIAPSIYTIMVDCMALNNENGPTFSQGSGLLKNSSGTLYVYNMTVHNVHYRGIMRNQGTLVSTNCVVSSTPSQGCFEGTQTQSYNCSSDATASGTGSRINQTVTYLDASNPGDYHLDPADTGARGFGVSLEADPTYPFDDDCDLGTIITWSMGADSIDDSEDSGAGGGVSTFLRRRRR